MKILIIQKLRDIVIEILYWIGYQSVHKNRMLFVSIATKIEMKEIYISL